MISILEMRSCRGGGGGPEKTILFSALEHKAEFSLHVVYLRSKVDPEFDIDQRARALGVKRFSAIEESGKFSFAALRTLLNMVDQHRIQIIHSHCYKSDLYALLISRLRNIRLVSTAHGPLATSRYFWRSKNWKVRYLYDQIDLRILRYFDKVIMVSDTMRAIIERHGVDSEKLIWIRNSIDSKYFSRSRTEAATFRDEIGVPKNAFLVGAVGRLNGEKDYHTLIDAAKIVLAKNSNAYFVVLGKGELEAELISYVKDKQISERFLFAGHRHDVRPFFASMDLYVLSSTREGLPNTLLEAMAMQVPVVSTDVDGVREAVEPNRHALLVEPQNPTALANAIIRLTGDAQLRRCLSDNARRRVEEEFSFATRTRSVEQIYKDVLA